MGVLIIRMILFWNVYWGRFIELMQPGLQRDLQNLKKLPFMLALEGVEDDVRKVLHSRLLEVEI